MNLGIKKIKTAQLLGSLPGLLLYLSALVFPQLFPVPQSFMIALGIAALVINLWVAEPIPIWLTSLLPLVLLPLHGIFEFKIALANYYSKNILLFFGGFVLAYSIEKWNLHQRFAYKLLSLTGSNPKGIVLGTMLSTFAISMWISNTATAIMILPVVMSIVKIAQKEVEVNLKPFYICLTLGVAYGANIGGIATLIGTPPNIVYKGYVQELLKSDISFLQWMLFALPIALLMLWLTYWLMTNFIFKMNRTPLPQVAKFLDEQTLNKSKLNITEKRVLLVFGLAVFFWIFLQPINSLINTIGIKFKIEEHTVALFFTLILFIVPSGSVKNTKLIDLKDLKLISWDILLLFGGGLFMAKGLETTGVITWFGEFIHHGFSDNFYLLSFLLILAALFLTELMSNVALTQIFIPVVFGVCSSIGLENPHQLGIPVTIAASFAFMFPISTPPNAVVYSSGLIKIKDMVKAGIILNIVGVIILWLSSLYILPFIF